MDTKQSVGRTSNALPRYCYSLTMDQHSRLQRMSPLFNSSSATGQCTSRLESKSLYQFQEWVVTHFRDRKKLYTNCNPYLSVPWAHIPRKESESGRSGSHITYTFGLLAVWHHLGDSTEERSNAPSRCRVGIVS
jgi:hypothetical protein